jgi:hypothetical protein
MLQLNTQSLLQTEVCACSQTSDESIFTYIQIYNHKYIRIHTLVLSSKRAVECVRQLVFALAE